MSIQDLDDYELISRWRDVRTDAALCTEPVPKRFMNAYIDALKEEMDRRCPRYSPQPEQAAP